MLGIFSHEQSKPILYSLRDRCLRFQKSYILFLLEKSESNKIITADEYRIIESLLYSLNSYHEYLETKDDLNIKRLEYDKKWEELLSLARMSTQEQ